MYVNDSNAFQFVHPLDKYKTTCAATRDQLDGKNPSGLSLWGTSNIKTAKMIENYVLGRDVYVNGSG